MGVVPDGWTVETPEKNLDATTNLVGGKERREEVSSDGCSTGFVIDLIISHRNFISLDSCAANGARFPPEMPRSRFGDRRCQGLGRVGQMKQDEGEDW